VLLARQLFLVRVVEEGEKSGWDTWLCLHLNLAEFVGVKLKKRRTFVFLVPDIRVWKAPHDATQHLPAPQQDPFHFKRSQNGSSWKASLEII